MSRRSMGELRQLQSLPLEQKIIATCKRIRDWFDEFGEDNIIISFSGGKDSTVLLDIVRNVCGYTKTRAVFVDTPTQYPELRQFVQTFDGVDIIKPQMTFVDICKKYGFPMISKEVSRLVYGARKYMENCKKNNTPMDGMSGTYCYCYRELMGINEPGKDSPKLYNDRAKFAFMLNANFSISDQCCVMMKEYPLQKYYREENAAGMTGQMAEESPRRTQVWLKYGCNHFDSKMPISNPMAFWTEQDVLRYIYENNLPICSVYGDVVQYKDIFSKEYKYKTTGAKRTGCMLCGFGLHLEKNPNRLQLIEKTHPGLYKILDVVKNNGVTYRQAIDWFNANSKYHIKTHM